MGGKWGKGEENEARRKMEQTRGQKMIVIGKDRSKGEGQKQTRA